MLAEKGTKRRFNDILRTSFKELQINPGSRAAAVQDQPVGRKTVKTGTAAYETNRTAPAGAKGTARECHKPSLVTPKHFQCVRAVTKHPVRRSISSNHFRTQCNDSKTTPPTATANASTVTSNAITTTPTTGSTPTTHTTASIITAKPPATTAATNTTSLTPTIGKNIPDTPPPNTALTLIPTFSNAN
ncbi:hypothetical protein SprV_0100314400 [Sparganum proliferum]